MRLNSATLKALPEHQKIERIILSALAAADPARAVKRNLSLNVNKLNIAGQSYSLDSSSRIFLVGAGKAAISMARGALDVVGNRITAGVIIAKHIDEMAAVGFPPQIKLLQGSHPVPDGTSVASTRQLVDLIQNLQPNDVVITLISGGGSALLTLPVDGVSLADIQGLTRLLLASGADITEINTLRKHLDRVKGGGLARFVFPARMITLILSDVIGSPLDVIASGPTVADPTTYRDALAILEKYHLKSKVPGAILAHLNLGITGKVGESGKIGDAIFENVDNQVVASNQGSASAAKETATAEGFNSLLITTYMRGEARLAGDFMAAILRQMALNGQPVSRPGCVIFGGETTVTVQGSGLGGRNLELALGAVTGLSGLDRALLITLATDGEDGPTDAAGAVISGGTLIQSRRLGLDPVAFLNQNDSYHFFENLGDILKTGPTGTNVNDLAFLFTL